jgi:hypothetical protein
MPDHNDESYDPEMAMEAAMAMAMALLGSEIRAVAQFVRDLAEVDASADPVTAGLQAKALEWLAADIERGHKGGTIVFERTVCCPSCGGGIVIRDEDDRIARIAWGPEAEERAQRLLKPNERIAICAMCGGKQEVEALVVVGRRAADHP